MRIKLESYLSLMSGRRGDLVYCCIRGSGRIYARRYEYPQLNQNNRRVGSVTANVFALEPAQGYRQDLREYLWRYNKLRDNRGNPINNWTGLYLKLMYALARQGEGIDLATLTRAEIEAQNLPCRSVRRAVEAGLLPPVRGYETLERTL